MIKPSSLSVARNKRHRHHRLCLERLEDRRLLTLPPQLNFTNGADHFIRLDDVQQDINGDCVINANERLASPQTYTIAGTIRGQAADASPHSLSIQLRRSSDQTVLSSLSAANLTDSGDNRTFAFELLLPAGEVSENTNSFHVFLERPGVFTLNNILNFTLTVDATRPAANIDTIIGSPRNTAVDQVEVTFSESIQNATFTPDDITLTRDDGSNLLTNAVNVALKSGTTRTFSVSGLSGLTNINGDYRLTVSASGIMDLAGNSGIGSDQVQWEQDTTPPTANDPPQLNTDDDLGRFNNDAVTKLNRELTFTSVADGAALVTFQIHDESGALFAQSLGSRLTGTNSYETTFSDILVDGVYKVSVVATDNVNPATTSPALTLVIDTVSPVPPTLSAGASGRIVSAPPIEILLSNTEVNAEVTLSRDSVGAVVTQSPEAGQSISRLSDNPNEIDPNGETFQYTAIQTDLAGNTSVSSSTFVAVVDLVPPKLSSFTLVSADNTLPNSALPVPLTRSTRPGFEVRLDDQQYAELINAVTIELFLNDDLVNPAGAGAASFLPQGVTVSKVSTDASQQVQVSLNPGVELESGYQYDLTFVATDSAGRKIQLVKQVFVLPVSNATQNAPGTPVFTETFFIGATALEVRPDARQIVVDQAIPLGYVINLVTTNNPIRVTGSSTDETTNRTTLTLDTTSLILNQVRIGDKVAWLRPWQMSFDKTTQTVWFTMEDGHHLGQFDPATGSVDLYDVSLGGTAFDPHGVFFDFNTHLTPRVWFVYRNEVEPGLDDAPPGAEVDNILRVAYFDVALQKLFTFDFEDIAGRFDLENEQHGGGTGSGGGGGTGSGGGTGGGGTTAAVVSALRFGHAVFVDTTGSVWITAEGSGTLVELDFDDTRGLRGSGAKIGGTSARTIAHTVPAEFASEDKRSSDFNVHGVQVVVDERVERGGERYVWVVNGNSEVRESVQRIALLVPGETDRWFEFSFPRMVPGGAHLLFSAFDDNETPGVPEDDRLIFTDTGFGFTGGGDGLIASLDVGPIVRAIQAGQDLDGFVPTIHVVQVPKLPGTNATANNAAPIQSFVDRGGTIYYVDPQSGVGRLSMDEFLSDNGQATTSGTLAVDVTGSLRSASTQAPHVRIDLAEATTRLTPSSVKFDSISGSDAARSIDRGQLKGVDQYEVAAEALRRGNGEGSFRGALNAANTLYGSLAQSDHLSTTIFAESARRQMSVATKPDTPQFATPAGVITEARMAFQVLRNGSLVLTARGDARIADSQINLLGQMLSDQRISETEAAELLITGEASAVTMPNGSVHVMGRSPQGGVVQFTFTPDGNDWAHDNLLNTANWSASYRRIPGVILAEDTVPAGPLGFSATTSDGHWIAIPINPNAATRDLTLESGNVDASRVYSAVSVTPGDNGVLFGYGTNQTGNLIEYRIDGTSVTTRQIDAISRETRMMRNVRALTIGDVRHVFATDGVSRLVHWQISTSGVQQNNISQQTADNGQNYGYFPFQQPYTGRVYTYIAPLLEDDGTLRVYGTNGGDLIEFTRPAGGLSAGQWRVANLTNDTNATYGSDGPGYRVPANAVFGGPTAYIDSKGGRHILQINAEGEVVEYFTYGDRLFPSDPASADRFNSQNVNFFSKAKIEDLIAALPELAPVTIPSRSVTVTAANAQTRDVNRDGSVTPQDALRVINFLSRSPFSEGEIADVTRNVEAINLDVNRDGKVTSLDALWIVNYLNRAQTGESELLSLTVHDDDDNAELEAVDKVMAGLGVSQLF